MKIKDIVTIRAGFAFKGEHFTNAGTPVIKIKNISQEGNVNTKDTDYIDLKNYPNLPKDFLLKNNDWVIAMTGAEIGKTGKIYAKENEVFLLNQRVAKVESPKQYNNDYVGYLLSTPEYQKKILDTSHGSAQANISSSMIEDFEIPETTEEERKRIANILSSFDNKIEILKKENKILEDIVGNIFKEWFVKYNFPNKDGKPYKDSGGKMIDSELGPIPEGWRVGKLGDVCKMLASGGTPATNKPEYYGDKYNWFTTKELQDTFLLNSEKRISDKGLNNSAAKIFPKSSVLIAIYAAPTVGRLGILSSKATFNQATCGLVANDDFSNEFIFLYLLNERKNLNNLASGAAQQNLNVGIIRNYPVPLITKITNSKFIRTTKPLFNKIKKNIEEENNLREQKKKLLQKLIK